MRRIHLTTGHYLRALADAFTDTTRASTVIGRLLLGLVAFLMVAMMWTERFLTWDRFLQGGQDLELSLVALVVFLCLIILLAQRSQQAVALHLAIFQAVADVSRETMARCARSLRSNLAQLRENDTSAETAVNLFSGICLPPLRI